MLSRSRKIVVFSAVAIVLIAMVPTVLYVYPALLGAEEDKFYVGVTYCGNSTAEAQQLIDRVKGYTNLFVVQSGPLMSNLPAMEQICDYAVDSGLNIIVYYAYNGAADNTCANFTKIAGSRWGSHFLGLYYNDEPAGKLLDNTVNLVDPNGTQVGVGQDGTMSVYGDSSDNPSIHRTFLLQETSKFTGITNTKTVHLNSTSRLTLSTAQSIFQPLACCQIIT